MAADAAVFFGLWLLPESLGAAPRRSPALARCLVRAGCPLERIIAVEGNAARIGQYLAGHVDGCPPLRVFTTFRHARVPKGKTVLKISAKTTIPCDPGRRHVALACHGRRLPVVAPGRGERISRRPPPRELADATAA